MSKTEVLLRRVCAVEKSWSTVYVTVLCPWRFHRQKVNIDVSKYLILYRISNLPDCDRQAGKEHWLTILEWLKLLKSSFVNRCFFRLRSRQALFIFLMLNYEFTRRNVFPFLYNLNDVKPRHQFSGIEYFYPLLRGAYGIRTHFFAQLVVNRHHCIPFGEE